MRTGLSSTVVFVMSGLLVACGGAGGGRSTFPEAERTATSLIPEDAFIMGRLDAEALRATPAFVSVRDRLERTQGSEVTTLVMGTTRVYFAVGGLVDVPTPVAPDGDPAPGRPPWHELAEVFGGRIPKAVGILEGDAAALCSVALMEAVSTETVRTSGEYRYAVHQGVAIIMRGQSLCAVTFEPVVPYLLGETSGPAPIIGRLAAIADGADFGIASVAFELDSPAFRAMIEGIGPTDPDANDLQIADAVRRVVNIFLRGIEATEWQLGRNDTGYVSRSRIQMSDMDRGVMWREITQMYFDILNALVESGVFGEDVNTHLRGLVADTRIERRSDGHIVVTGISDARVASFIDAISPTQGVRDFENGTEVSVEPAPVNLDGSAAETIESVEPNIASSMQTYEGRAAIHELARAYMTVGRFADAKRLLRQAMDAQTDEVATRAAYAAPLCEFELYTGHAAEALAVANAQIEACASSYCGDALGELTSCQFVARAMGGDVEALDGLEQSTSLIYMDEPSLGFGGTRGRLLFAAGRYLEAAASIRAVCVGTAQGDRCLPFELVEAEAMARADVPLARAFQATVRARIASANLINARAQQETNVRLMSIECLAQSTRAPASDDANTACQSAVENATSVHGASHVETAFAALAYARVLTARRDTAGAARELAKVDAVLPSLGPAHRLRADRASAGARPAGRGR